MKEIIEILGDKRFPNHKWFDFGLKLNIIHNTLKDIEKDEGGCNACLRECLAVWLKTGSATYKELIEAVRGIGEPPVADAIEEHLSTK